MFFKNFNHVLYDFTVKTDSQKYHDVVQDLTTRVTTYIKPKDLDSLCSSYLINDNDTPELIAQLLYGNSELHWVIMYINEIADIYSEWPLSEANLMSYCIEKYGSALYDTRWTIKIPEMIVMNRSLIESLYGTDYAVDVTNWDFEVQQNEQKRFIKVIKPEFIGEFVDQFMSNLIK
jgi:hypothetical protein